MAADASQQQRGAVTLPHLRIHSATTVAELRSAAYLRAYTFYTYPEGRSQFSTRVGGGLLTTAGGLAGTSGPRLPAQLLASQPAHAVTAAEP